MSYPTLSNAVSKIVFDAQVKAIKDFKEFLAARVDVSEMEGDFDEFLQTLKPTTVPVGKKASKAIADPSKKKREPTLFNFFVKDRMVSLKMENPDKNGKVILTLASEAWKSDPFATFLKENLQAIKDEASDSSNESVYQLAKEKFNTLSEVSKTNSPGAKADAESKAKAKPKASKASKKGKKAEPEAEPEAEADPETDSE